MGCFLGCFGGSSKDRKKRRKQRYKVIPRIQNPTSENPVQADVTLVQTVKENTCNSPPETRVKSEEPLSVSTRKKVTFDTNVTTYEHVQVYDSTESLLEKNEKGETFPKSRENLSQDDSEVVSVGSYPPNYRVKSEEPLSVSTRKKVTFDTNVTTYEHVQVYDSTESLLEKNEKGETFPKSRENLSQDDSEVIIREDVWCESVRVDKIGSNSNARDRSASVLNPVENLTQWKALKSKETMTQNFSSQKENSSLNLVSFQPKNRNQEIAVDASLSNWLGKGLSQESTTPPVKSTEDRPIIGALTADELKQFSGSSCTPRKSPSRSPDDMPIIGSVGSYWSHTDSGKSLSSTASYKGIPNTTSKYREDKKVNWHNTPFETRLERALNRDVAEAKY
ncbi:serine/threonine-protein kinase pakF [Artemisia annua]|uniref:Serine/threonine-protein kinase pakF n=1 Tax=Artemisia annua TaxID=35608 RepID=A0A2U1KBS1_ARTAN|nr:serine/threonine-protein kinase pakF [Artemisia annua]